MNIFSENWRISQQEQNEALIADVKKVDKHLRSLCSLRFRIWLKFLDLLDWVANHLV